MDGAGQASQSSPQENYYSRLACQACQRKKIKCDRTFPCGQCQKSNLQCTQSARKQRVRHAAKRAMDGELKMRISKLESLVQSLGGMPSPPVGQDGSAQERSQSLDSSVTSPVVGNYVAGPFWLSLSSEVQALRDALEDDQESETPESIPQDPSSSLEHDLIFCPPGKIYVMPGAMGEPTPEVAQRLFVAFLQNVEPMYKIFHRPTLISFMQDGATYLGKPYDTPANLALKRSVWFAAVSSLGEQDCQTILGQSQEEALNHYKRLVGISLTQADLVNTMEIATVQAFVTYLASLRQSDTTRRVWTLVATLVRIARAMILHHENPRLTRFEIELRRRLWYSIRFLDIFCAMDRGSEPLITTGTHSVPMPVNTNDVDFDEQSVSIPIREGPFTDTSFAIMSHEVCEVVERLTKPEIYATDETWEKRLQIAQEKGSELRERWLKHYNLDDPYQRFCHAVGETMATNMVLRAVRPISRHVSSIPPRVDSPYVLRIAIDALVSSEMVYTDPETERWRWMTWVPWHALAVALAGLCSIRGTPLAEKAWYYAERQYERCASVIADSREGMLFKPIEKLYKKASDFREAVPKPAIEPPLKQEYLQTSVPALETPAYHAFAFSPSAPAALPQTLSVNISGTATSFPPVSQELPTRSAFGTIGGLPTNASQLEPFPNDESWLDWEQIMYDFANNPDFMNGTQANFMG